MNVVAKSVKGGLVAACDKTAAKTVVHTSENLGLAEGDMDKYEDDLENLKIGAAESINDFAVDVIDGLDNIDNRSWAGGPMTPAKGDKRAPIQSTLGREAAVWDGSGKNVPFSPSFPRRSPRRAPQSDVTPVKNGPMTSGGETPVEERPKTRGRGHTYKPTSAQKKSDKNQSNSRKFLERGTKPTQSGFQEKMAAMAKKRDTVCILYHCAFLLVMRIINHFVFLECYAKGEEEERRWN